MSEVILIVLSFIMPCVNFSVMLLSLPRRWKLGYTLLAFTGVLLLVRFPVSEVFDFLELEGSYRRILSGLVFLPFLMVLFCGKFSQKLFAYLMQMVLSSFMMLLSEVASVGFFPPSGNMLFRLVLLFLLCIGYITLAYTFGRQLLMKLFIDGHSAAWGFYAFSAVVLFSAVVISMRFELIIVQVLTMLITIWSFCILCYAIINANEKAKHKYEAEFAQDIISTGSDHYQMMNEMYETLLIFRHDYKYHLNVIGKLLSSGDTNEVEKYLTDLQKQLKGLPNYCSNTVLNALLASYAARCTKMDIKYTVKVFLPEHMDIPDYEICIVLGNLLENAVEACEKLEGSRKIDVNINTQGPTLAIMVQNSFSRVTKNENTLVSTKKDGGLGFRSIQAVAGRYSGELMTEWDENMFSAYVLMKI